MNLEIPDSLFKRLQKHAIPLVDTPVSVIERCIDHFEGASSNIPKRTASPTLAPDRNAKSFSFAKPPDLFHTRVRGTFGSVPFSNWNDLLRIAHVEAFGKAKTYEELRTVTHAQIRKGRYSDSGYHFLPEIGISVQGVDSNHAWVYALRLAQYLKIPLRALVEWRHNGKAAHPGMSGTLEWSP